MSAADVRKVKAAVASWIERNTDVDAVRPGTLATIVAADTGLDFGATTIARYLRGHGWRPARLDTPLGRGPFYVRPIAEQAGAPAAADAPTPRTPRRCRGADVAAGSKLETGTLPTGSGD